MVAACEEAEENGAGGRINEELQQVPILQPPETGLIEPGRDDYGVSPDWTTVPLKSVVPDVIVNLTAVHGTR